MFASKHSDAFHFPLIFIFLGPPSGKPSVTTSRTVLRPGDLLRLTCNLNNKGVPAANKYTWYKNGKFIKDSGKSHVWNIRVTSEAVSGSFSCKAANKKGSSEVSIPQCVAFTRETKTKQGKEGHSMQGGFQCRPRFCYFPSRNHKYTVNVMQPPQAIQHYAKFVMYE